MPTAREIIEYYAFSKLDYRLYNGSMSDLSMHYGLWDEGTHSHREALANENRIVAKIAAIRRNDHVIDLGCGYGSTAVWLASHLGCRVTGITLSDDQVADAKRWAKKRKVEHLVEFCTMDFHHTSFPDSTFDVAISIESISHSSRKPHVLEEVWRILKPGGRIVIADGYFGRDKKLLTSREHEIATTCFEGVHVPPVPERGEFESWLVGAGFSHVRWFDMTTHILPTAQKVNRLGRALLPISKIFSVMGLRSLETSHMNAFVNQFYAFRDGLGVYGLFCGKKPSQIFARTRKVAKAPASPTVTA